MKRFVLVTGASSGIGRQATLALAQEGYYVIAGVRSEYDVQILREEGSPNILPVIMDVTSPEEVAQALNTVSAWTNEGILVAIINNAGSVVHGTVLDIPIDEWQRQFDVNLFGLIRVTQTFFPLLLKHHTSPDDHPRRIINIGSVSGRFASPFLGPYAASKFALEAVSDSLRRELYYTEVKVVIIQAGKIATPIWNKARTGPSYIGPEHQHVAGFKDKLLDKMISEGLPQDALNPVILKAMKTKKVKTRYLVVPNPWGFRLSIWLPDRWIDKIIHKRLKAQAGIRPF